MEMKIRSCAFFHSANEAEPPFAILDEVDAALDHSNTMKVVNYLKRNDRNQKIFITHKNEILVEADTLIGITSRVRQIYKFIFF